MAVVGRLARRLAAREERWWLVRYVHEQSRAFGNIAEVSASEGFVAERLATSYARYYCVDYDPARLGRARRRLGRTPDVHFLTWDSIEAARPVDVVLAVDVFERAPDPQRTLEQLLSPLEPGGRLVMTLGNEAVRSQLRRLPGIGNGVRKERRYDLDAFEELLVSNSHLGYKVVDRRVSPGPGLSLYGCVEKLSSAG